jgi:hypothetical protein
MRIRDKAFVSGAVVAVVGLLSAPAAMATGSYSCSSFYAGAGVSAVAGPCPVASANPAACEPSGSYTGFTGIKYRVTGSPEYIAALVTANNTVVSAGQTSAACVGDSATGLGKQSCHEKAVAFGCNVATAEFWIVVTGQKTAVLQSVALKKSSCIKSFAVPGLGSDSNPFQTARKTETVNFKGCAVDFVFDPVTGAVVSAQLNTAESKPVCSGTEAAGTCCSPVVQQDVSQLQLYLGTQPLGAGVFGDGYVSSGTNSCTTRVIGGRVYTWGSPCPE